MIRFVSRVVDRGALVAAAVGAGVAVTVGVSFLLVVPIEPVVWLLALPAGLLIGYYANARSDRRSGPWRRIVANALLSGAVTAATLAALMLGVKAIFFAADDGYRDAGLGGPIDCATGVDCVYHRYLETQASDLAAAGVTDAASFGRYYWDQQLAAAGLVIVLTLAGGVGGGLVYGLANRPSRPVAEGSLAAKP